MQTHVAERDLAVAAAEAAGDHVLGYFRTGVETEWKGPGDTVTVADRESERLVRDLIAEAFPGDVVVGEEGEQPPEGELAGRRRWYVDPLDGTTNFTKGQPRFAVAVACADAEGRLIAAAVRRPIEGETLAATAGGGAHLDGRRLQVQDVDPSEAMALLGPLGGLVQVVPSIARTTLVLRITGSTVADLADVACGRAELYLGTDQGRWDVAAGTLLAREAGAVTTDLAGTPLAGVAPGVLVGTPRAHAAVADAVRAASGEDGTLGRVAGLAAQVGRTLRR